MSSPMSVVRRLWVQKLGTKPKVPETKNMAVDIRLASARERVKPDISEDLTNLVTPGDVITSDTGFMR